MIGAVIQKKIVQILKGMDALGGGVYDRVPENPVFPYVSLGDDQVIDDGNTCGDGWEVFADVHVWSRPAKGSKREVKEIAGAVAAAICGIDTIDGHRLVSVNLESISTSREADGITEHSYLVFRFLT